MSTYSAFMARYNAIEKVIPYNSNWGNNTGYLDNAVEGRHKVDLPIGEMAKSIIPAKGNSAQDGDRKIIFIGTPLGTVAIFQRYGNTEDVFTHSTTKAFQFSGLLPNKRIFEVTMTQMVGDPQSSMPNDNVGTMLKRIFQTMQEFGMV